MQSAKKPQRRASKHRRLHGKRHHDVLPHDTQGTPRVPHGSGELSGVVVHQHDVRGLDRHVRPERAHRDTHIGTGKHGRVVDAVTHEKKCSLVRSAEQHLDLAHLIGRQQLGTPFRNAKRCRHAGGAFLAVARQHHGAPHTKRIKIGDRLACPRFHSVRYHDRAQISALTGCEKHSSLPVVGGNCVHAKLAHQRGVANGNFRSIHHGAHPSARHLGDLRGTRQSRAIRRPLQRLCDGVIGLCLRRRGKAEQLFL